MLLNDPTYVETARALAARIVKEGGADADARITWAWRQALQRTPSDKERAVAKRVLDKHQKDYAADAMDIRNTLVSKMQELEAEEFEELLRPAFREEEWMLIATGALLGFAVGEVQVLALEFLAS